MRKLILLLPILVALLIGGCTRHIGMWNAEDGHAPDADQDGVLDTHDDCPGTPLRTRVNARGCNIDDDRDGVINPADACPGTAPDVLVDARGCAVDSDGDGVIDGADDCPGTPPDTPVNGRGCPLDSDGDGVLDSADRCPGTPRGETVDRLGCADLVPKLPVLGDVHFAVDSAELTPYAYPVLDEVARLLREYPGARLRVVGHTDSTATDAYNLDLSRRRAQSVVRYLTEQGGISPLRLLPLGLGEQAPIASNGTSEGRARNRRVEFMMDQSLDQLRMRRGSVAPTLDEYPRAGTSETGTRRQLERQDSSSFDRMRQQDPKTRRRMDAQPSASSNEQREFERLRERDRFLRQLIQQQTEDAEQTDSQ